MTEFEVMTMPQLVKKTMLGARDNIYIFYFKFVYDLEPCPPYNGSFGVPRALIDTPNNPRNTLRWTRG